MIIIDKVKRIKNQSILKLAIFIVAIVISNLLMTSSAKEINYEYLDTVAIASYDKVEKVIKDSYIKDVASSDKDIQGLFKELDRHSKYYEKNEFDSFIKNLSGDLGEIGIELSKDGKNIIIENVKEGSPAKKAKIEKGSILLEVNKKSMIDKSIQEALQEIIGKKNSDISIVLSKDGKEEEKTVKRSLAFNKDVSHRINGGIGYIKISQFNKQSHSAVAKAVKEMEDAKVENVIIDLRDNRGGYLDQSIKIAEIFVPKGPIVYVDYGKARGSVTYSSFSEKQKFEDVVVLTNKLTASASEVLVGAIKDRDVGTIVGEKTYGKGTIQEIVKLDTGEGMKITVAEYFSPNRSKIDGKGITPDIVVKNIDTDNQLLKAVELLSK